VSAERDNHTPSKEELRYLLVPADTKHLLKLQKFHRKSLRQNLKSLQLQKADLVLDQMLHQFNKKLTAKRVIKPPPNPTITHKTPSQALSPSAELPPLELKPALDKLGPGPSIESSVILQAEPQHTISKPKFGKTRLSQTSLEPAKPNEPLRIYDLRNLYHGRRISMDSIGIDIGTKNIVLACKDGDEIVFLVEVNGYYIYPNPSKFIKNMLDDPSKVRSDGTKRPARWIEFEDRKGVYVLGKDAEELAYAHNDTMLRPMAEGGVSQDEDAMMVLASIVQGLLEMATKDVGKLDSKSHICYCTTAPAINASSNISYHKQVIDLILDGFDAGSEIESSSITESHAIVLKESPDDTGIGISWGAGTVTVSYVKWGDEVYSFCWVGAGDWIDLEVAKRHGYDPDKPRLKSKETPTTVCRAKERIDLSSDDTPSDRLNLDIVLHYRILIQNVIRGIVQGFIDNENQARIDDAINVYMAGGTSSPLGFAGLVKELLVEEEPPFAIDQVYNCENPLVAVAEGCLRHSEMNH
jgi:hypothetical protein